MSRGVVFVVEDDQGLSQTIKDALTFAGYQVLVWGDAESFLEDAPALEPAVLITDMRLPHQSGLEMHLLLRQQGYQLPVIYISGESHLQEGIDAMKSGAIDFLLKPFGLEDLLAAIDKAFVSARIAKQQALAANYSQQVMDVLSPRQRQVCDLMLRGFNNSEIMDALEISLPTTKQYKSEVLAKLGVRSLSQLISLCTYEA